jgi:hypothetical protein
VKQYFSFHNSIKTIERSIFERLVKRVDGHEREKDEERLSIFFLKTGSPLPRKIKGLSLNNEDDAATFQDILLLGCLLDCGFVFSNFKAESSLKRERVE